ncbi:hypothetical protein BT63DRAFT_311037 [Microthyrium microscopicum]|uniref:Uncharacterized protein n=1 Tax=Microthyrium microscopicum TaxID=703497 RepID=A0A6A6U2L6_9PEZI|nr:hypothetical protein BT63DRAFT_311037 [Microthyrium microscopicum]
MDADLFAKGLASLLKGVRGDHLNIVKWILRRATASVQLLERGHLVCEFHNFFRLKVCVCTTRALFSVRRRNFRTSAR